MIATSLSILPLNLQGVQPRYLVKWLFYLCNDFRLTHDTLLSLNGLTSQETPHTSTPLVKNATSVGLATGKEYGSSVVSQGHIYKRTNPSSALGAFCYFNVNRSQDKHNEVWSGKDRNSLYPPLENLCPKG